MLAYVIAQKDSEDLVTQVFQSGPAEAAIVFTSPETASRYIADANLEATHTPAELEEIPFLKWLACAHDDGVAHAVVDPTYEAVESGTLVDSIDIEAQLAQAARHILQLARPDF